MNQVLMKMITGWNKTDIQAEVEVLAQSVVYFPTSIINLYSVKVKEVYNYSGVEAKSEEEAKQLVLDMDWRSHDEMETPLEIIAEEEKPLRGGKWLTKT